MAVEEVVDLNAVQPGILETPERYCTQPRFWVPMKRRCRPSSTVDEKRPQFGSMS